MVITCEALNHLRFAEHIVLISSNIQELGKMLEVLAETALKFGLVMNTPMTKILSSSEDNIYSQNIKLENILEFIYLWHTIRLGGENQVA